MESERQRQCLDTVHFSIWVDFISIRLYCSEVGWPAKLFAFWLTTEAFCLGTHSLLCLLPFLSFYSRCPVAWKIKNQSPQFISWSSEIEESNKNPSEFGRESQASTLMSISTNQTTARAMLFSTSSFKHILHYLMKDSLITCVNLACKVSIQAPSRLATIWV